MMSYKNLIPNHFGLPSSIEIFILQEPRHVIQDFDVKVQEKINRENCLFISQTVLKIFAILKLCKAIHFNQSPSKFLMGIISEYGCLCQFNFLENNF